MAFMHSSESRRSRRATPGSRMARIHGWLRTAPSHKMAPAFECGGAAELPWRLCLLLVVCHMNALLAPVGRPVAAVVASSGMRFLALLQLLLSAEQTAPSPPSLEYIDECCCSNLLFRESKEWLGNALVVFGEDVAFRCLYV